MYFTDRAAAGRELAQKLLAYKNQPTMVVALSKGAVIVGAQIAIELHASLVLYMVENINLPGENDAIGGISSTGNFAYNNFFSPQEIDEMVSEFHGYIDQQRFDKLHQLNVLVGKDGVIEKNRVRHHVVILVSDGLASAFPLDIANEYFKRIATKKVVLAVAVAAASSVDRMHLVSDQVECLNITPNFFGADHYYDNNSVPPLEDLISLMKNISLTWRDDSKTADNV